jgi:hypothetical protein
MMPLISTLSLNVPGYHSCEVEEATMHLANARERPGVDRAGLIFEAWFPLD